MAHGEERPCHLLLGGGSSREAEARYGSHRVDGCEAAETFIPSQTNAPSYVGVAGHPSPLRFSRPERACLAVEDFMGTFPSPHDLRQAQSNFLDESRTWERTERSNCERPGTGGEGVAQMANRVA